MIGSLIETVSNPFLSQDDESNISPHHAKGLGMQGCCARGYSNRDNKPEDHRARVRDPHYVEDQEQNQIVFLEDAIHHDRKMS